MQYTRNIRNPAVSGVSGDEGKDNGEWVAICPARLESPTAFHLPHNVEDSSKLDFQESNGAMQSKR